MRFYVPEGLIDHPCKDGRHAVYGERHLLQLLLVRSLASRGLSLSAIAPLVVGTDNELKDQLLQLDDEPHSQSPNPEMAEALAFLQSVRSSGSPLSSRSPSLRVSPMSGRSASALSRWHRFLLAPGVELHLSESVSIPASSEALSYVIVSRLIRAVDQARELPCQRLFHNFFWEVCYFFEKYCVQSFAIEGSLDADAA